MKKFIVIGLFLMASFNTYSSANTKIHIVKSGDTLLSLIKKYNYPNNTWQDRLDSMKLFNDLNKQHYKKNNPHSLVIGSELLLPPNPNAISVPKPKVDITYDSRIGVIDITNGEVEIISNNEVITLSGNKEAQHSLYQGDIIHSENDSQAVLKMNDDSSIIIGSATKLSIEEYQFTPENPSTSKSVMRFFTGVINSISGKISKQNPDAVEVKTIVAAIGTRGTNYTARYCDGNQCGDLAGMSLAVKEGKVLTENDKGNSEELAENEFVQVDKTGDISEVTEVPEGFFDITKSVGSISVKKTKKRRRSKLINRAF